MNAKNSKSVPQANLSVARVQIDGQRLPVKVFLFCLSTEVVLVLLDATINYYEWSKFETIQGLFDIGKELSLTSWFMVSQTFIAALTVFAYLLVHLTLLVTKEKEWFENDSKCWIICFVSGSLKFGSSG